MYICVNDYAIAMGAPKGNKYSTGRKPIYDTPDSLQEAIEEYLVFCEGEYHMEEREDEDGRFAETQVWDRNPQRPTITGLCLFLGFESRNSFYEYGKRESFKYIVKKAQLIIESEYEQMLATKAVTGAIFALKNMGWEDKTKQEHTGKDGESLFSQVNINVHQKRKEDEA